MIYTEIFEPYVERLTVYFTSIEYLNEVSQAKREFFERSSVLDEEDQQFELLMSQFLDWYLFSRPLSDADIAPVDYALQTDKFPMSKEDRKYFEYLAAYEHSLYEFVKLRGDDVHIRDLFTGFTRVLKNSSMTYGFNYDEIFDVRIFPYEDTWVFAKGFCFHPVEAKKFVLAEVAKATNFTLSEKETLLLRLARMRHRLDQYKHIHFEHIYTNQTRVKV
jgi:hypothetical protein